MMARALVNSGGITYETSLSFEAQESPLFFFLLDLKLLSEITLTILLSF